MTPLHRAAWLGAAEEFELLMETVPTGHACLNRRAMTRFNCTSFILACERGHVAVVRELLAKGCDTELQNSEGKTGWEVAKAEGRKEIDEMLKEYAQSGAMPKARAALAEELRLQTHLPEGSAHWARAGRIPFERFVGWEYAGHSHPNWQVIKKGVQGAVYPS